MHRRCSNAFQYETSDFPNRHSSLSLTVSEIDYDKLSALKRKFFGYLITRMYPVSNVLG